LFSLVRCGRVGFLIYAISLRLPSSMNKIKNKKKTLLRHSFLCTTSPPPTVSPISAENSLHSTLDLCLRSNPDGSQQTKCDKGNAPPLSSSPSPALRHRTSPLYRDCLPSPPTSDLRDASVSTRLPNASTVTSSATTHSSAPARPHAVGAPNHIQLGTTPVPQPPAPPEAASVRILHHCV
jgi:hypothetical protein